MIGRDQSHAWDLGQSLEGHQICTAAHAHGLLRCDVLQNSNHEFLEADFSVSLLVAGLHDVVDLVCARLSGDPGFLADRFQVVLGDEPWPVRVQGHKHVLQGHGAVVENIIA